MVRSDLLAALARAGSPDDKRGVRATTQAVIAEGRQKEDTILPHQRAYEPASESAAVSQA